MFISLLLYLAFAVFVLGVGARIWRYARTPAPLKIPTMPAPMTRSGVFMRLVREVVLFESLFKASRWTWIFGWLFHAGLLIVLLAHLRFFTQPVWGWVVFIAPFSRFAGIAMVVGLIGLLCRRVWVPRVRYISAPSDYLMLLFLISLAGSGLLMRYFFHTDIVSVKQFALGMLSLDLASIPGDFVLWLHVLLVASLLLIFPFSKLLHAPGLFFSPSLNQRDNTRERRHVNPWASQIEKRK